MGITKKTVERILTMYKDGYTCEEIATIFGIRESIIRVITSTTK